MKLWKAYHKISNEHLYNILLFASSFSSLYAMRLIPEIGVTLVNGIIILQTKLLNLEDMCSVELLITLWTSQIQYLG